MINFKIFSIFVCIFSVFIIFTAYKMKENISFYKTPSEILLKKDIDNKQLKIGGYILPGSVKKDGNNIKFTISDSNASINVSYLGNVPPMFSEGTGVIATGRFNGGVFIANELLSKHDERYYPKQKMNFR